MFDFTEFRDQVHEWSDRNFGVNETKHHRPLLGMFEELQELIRAYEDFDAARPRSMSSSAINEIKDAIGDILVYGADYAARKKWDYEKLATAGFRMQGDTDVYSALRRLTKFLGKMAHHHLKTEQGIRGNAEEHDLQAQQEMVHVFGTLNFICTKFGWEIRQIVEQIWNRVRQRDWTKDKKTGGEAG